MRSTFTLSEFHSFMDWLESELGKLASDVENHSSPIPPAAMNLLKYLYHDARKAVSQRQNFIFAFEARYEARSTGPYMVRAQVQSPQQPTNVCLLLR
jgi:hypothetical protein